MAAPAPQVTVSKSAAQRIKNFDAWVFRDEIVPPASPPANGEVVELIDSRGTFLGYAFYNQQSHVAARVVSTKREEPVTPELLAHRLTSSIRRRAKIASTDALRLVYSEADGLPGLIVDRYGDYLVLQSRSAGIERRKEAIVETLRKTLKPAGILERSDKEFREEEGLSASRQLLAGTVPERIRIEEHGLAFWVDPHKGHKTGFYLDQRDTRRRIRDLIEPSQKVLDIFSYTGAFGIAAASRGAEVICVEQQEPFLALAKEHAQLNQVAPRMQFVAADAFYWLEAAAKRADRFDWVLLDPPALAKSKADVQKGRQALHHLLINALALLAPNGTLVVSICTYHLLGLAEEILRIAAADCGTRLRILATSQQAEDHPWVLQMPMTRYLTTWVARRGE